MQYSAGLPFDLSYMILFLTVHGSESGNQNFPSQYNNSLFFILTLLF
jgi:hypothetical protein